MKLAAIVQASRPKTLPAAIVPVWLGCVLAYRLGDVFSPWMAACTLLFAVFIQIATNFFNDAIDAEKGADTKKRQGPKRVTASGMMSRKAVYVAAFSCLGVAAIFGILMLLESGWMMLLIGIPSFYLSYGYTGGPFPLAYRGMGEVFVLVFFGWIAVLGTVFVQLGEWRMEAFLLGTQVGLLSAMLILINNIRDRDEDAGTGKNTIAVMFGQRVAVGVLAMMLFACYGVGILWGEYGYAMATFLPMVGVLFGLYICLGVGGAIQEGKPAKLNKFLAFSGIHLILFGVLWTIGMYL